MEVALQTEPHLLAGTVNPTVGKRNVTLPIDNGLNLVEWRQRKEQARGQVTVFGRRLRVSKASQQGWQSPGGPGRRRTLRTGLWSGSYTRGEGALGEKVLPGFRFFIRKREHVKQVHVIRVSCIFTCARETITGLMLVSSELGFQLLLFPEHIWANP